MARYAVTEIEYLGIHFWEITVDDLGIGDGELLDFGRTCTWLGLSPGEEIKKLKESSDYKIVTIGNEALFCVDYCTLYIWLMFLTGEEVSEDVRPALFYAQEAILEAMMRTKGVFTNEA